ncbi:DM13 domain-containing protein [Nocardioides albidus]|uniref:DM13 domain-containing protein n=1 Tax=Nocardioides albidus TaxID=1517589 RepID=A0A5C4VUG0_9ACTN|nr:DM13 domain-containing protein [Nocardioides albidus]TNM39458.1 DM13 domain-containing protein [Nocardioides albidus]
MRGRRGVWLAIGAVLVAALVAALMIFEPWLLFVDDDVHEGDDPATVVGTASGGLTDSAVPSATDGAPTRVVLASARFIDGEHGTTGKAVIYRRSDGSRFLRIEDLETSNGPDLHVWLTDRPSGGDCEGCRDSWGIYDDGASVRLGPLKGNRGSQNYEIPASADLAPMRSVVIWCDRFNVAFGTAAVG